MIEVGSRRRAILTTVQAAQHPVVGAVPSGLRNLVVIVTQWRRRALKWNLRNLVGVKRFAPFRQFKSAYESNSFQAATARVDALTVA